jgi:hypothetical protein
MARPRNDVRTALTGLLQANAASVCYWHTSAETITLTTSVVSDLILTRTGKATCFVLLTRGWKSVSCKQCTVNRTLLYSFCVLLFKFARMVHIELYDEFFLGDRLQNSDVSETILSSFIR